MSSGRFDLPLALPGMRIGLLGGSFNPAHEGHRHISLTALKRLGLDQVWWLVTPGNPIKSEKAPSIETRAAAAAAIARHPRIQVSDFEKHLREAYTADTLGFLVSRFPQVHFVWLMGADNLAIFDRWKDWEELMALLPIAVFDRPGYRLKASGGKAAQRFARYRVEESGAGALPTMQPPAWTVITLPLSFASSTAIRKGENG